MIEVFLNEKFIKIYAVLSERKIIEVIFQSISFRF